MRNTPTAAFGEVTGQVTNSSDGTPVSGTVVQMSRPRKTQTITDANGNYVLIMSDTSGTYTVTPVAGELLIQS